MYDPKEVLKVCEKATPGWKAGKFKHVIVSDTVDNDVFSEKENKDYYGDNLIAESMHVNNRDFAILARTALPELAQRVIELETGVSVLKEILDRKGNDFRDIWIRSQNKCTLCKVYDLWVEGETILATYHDGDQSLLSYYNSKTEAIKALDMIQNYITELYFLPIQGHANFEYGPVFQMPPAGFSEEG